jgi:hypothetical protein
MYIHFIKCHVLRTFQVIEIKLHTLSVLAWYIMDGGGISARTCMDVVAKRKIAALAENQIPFIHPVAWYFNN